MITLTEKRLQELERKIPEFIAKIAEQQNKMIEIFNFPNDLDEMRKNCQVLSQNIKDYLSKFFDMQNASESKLIDIQKTEKSHAETIVKLKEADQSMDVILKALAGEMPVVHQNVLDLSSRHDLTVKRIEKLEARAKEFSIEIESICQNSKIHVENLVKHSMQIKDQKEESDRISVLMIKMQDVITKMKTDFHQQTHCFTLEISKLCVELAQVKAIEPKSYDSEIVEIKKDIISILSLMHPTTQIPDQSQWEKVKSLENHVAQIYALLKKYEPKV